MIAEVKRNPPADSKQGITLSAKLISIVKTDTTKAGKAVQTLQIGDSDGAFEVDFYPGNNPPLTQEDVGKTFSFLMWGKRFKNNVYLKCFLGTPEPVADVQVAKKPVEKNGNDVDWDAIAEGKIRHGLVCSGIQSGQIVLDGQRLIEELEYWQNYISTGRAPLPAGQTPF